MNKPFILKFIFTSFFLTIAVFFIFQIASTKPISKPVSKKQQEVLGESTITPKMFIYGDQDYGGGVIALSSLAEPRIEIASYKLSGDAEITVYKANKENLLNYLIHDKEGKQLNKDIEVSELEYVSRFNEQIKSGYDTGNRFTLPIQETGIWYLQIKLSENRKNQAIGAEFFANRTDPEQSEGSIITESAFIIRSSIGAILKEGDNQFIIWGQDLETKHSLADGNFKIYNLTNNISEIANAELNNEGTARTPLTSNADIGLIEQDENLALVPINLRYLNRGYSYKEFEPKKRQTKFYIFTDRPLYRPGGKIYFKTIIRDDDDARYSIPQGAAQVKVYKDWKEKNLIYEKTYEVTSEGTVYGEIIIPEDVSTGHYTLKVDLDPQSSNNGWQNWYRQSTTNFYIEHFRKPEYTIDLEIPEREYINNQTTSLKITGEYFSGQPISNQEVAYKIYSADFYEYDYLSDAVARLKDDYRYGHWGGKIINEGKAVFNSQGEAEVELKVKIPEGLYKTQVFSIEAQFDDGSGNPTFTRKNILVYPGEYGIYKKERIYTVRVGEKVKLPVILVPRKNLDINTTAVSLKSKLVLTTWTSRLDPDKKYPVWQKHKEELPEIKTKTNKDGEAVFAFTPEKKGSYKLTIEGKDKKGNTVLKEFRLWATSKDQPAYKGQGESTLSIHPNKERYEHGEIVQLTILSEIADRDIFLSLDRERINRFQVVRLEGKSKTIEIPLVETDMPNIFIKAVSFSETYLDSVREKIIVSTEPKQLKVSLTPDKKRYSPGENIKVEVKTTDSKKNPISADLAVWAVDKAIFELANKQGNIFETFWSERYDWTNQAHSLQGINVVMAEGGGGGGGGEVRKVFEDTAYWNPKLTTDQFGRAQISFKLPDNLTTWVVAGVGATSETMAGQTTEEIIVSKKVITRPTLPNILRIGDQIVLGAAVYNYTENDHVFDISLSFDSGQVKSGSHQELIKADDFFRAFWKVEPEKENEKAELAFSSKSTTDTEVDDSILQEIPVQKFGFWEKTGESAIGSKEFEINFSPDVDREKTEINLTLAPSLLGSLPSAMSYLVRYPYGCTEQITSSLAPAIIAKENPDIFEKTLADKDVDEIIKKGIVKLKKAQKPDGGWPWWSHGKTNPFVTAYVLDYLLKARNLGHEIEDEILQKGQKYLQQENKPEEFTKEERIAKSHALSLLGAKADSIANFDDLTPDFLSLAVMVNIRNGNSNPKSNGLAKLLSLSKIQGDAIYWQEGKKEFFGSKDASTALAVRAILEANTDKETASKAIRYLARNRQKHYWSNTFATAQVVRAVVDFSKTWEELTPNYQYKVRLDDRVIAQGAVQDWQKPLEEINLKGADIGKKGKISVERLGGQGEIYSTLVVNQFHTDKKAKAVNNGLEIMREYLNKKGKEYALGVGDTVEVRLTVSGLKATENYGIIVDQLPAGMIPINPTLKSEQFTEQKHQKGVSGREMTNDGMILSLRKIEPGRHVYSYKARVISEGIFNTPPARVFLMYAPEINGRSQAEVVKIAEKSKLAPLKAAERFVREKSKALWENKKLLAAIAAGGTLLVFSIWYLVSRKFKI